MTLKILLLINAKRNKNSQETFKETIQKRLDLR